MRRTARAPAAETGRTVSCATVRGLLESRVPMVLPGGRAEEAVRELVQGCSNTSACHQGEVTSHKFCDGVWWLPSTLFQASQTACVFGGGSHSLCCRRSYYNDKCVAGTLNRRHAPSLPFFQQKAKGGDSPCCWAMGPPLVRTGNRDAVLASESDPLSLCLVHICDILCPVL